MANSLERVCVCLVRLAKILGMNQKIYEEKDKKNHTYVFYIEVLEHIEKLNFDLTSF